MRISLIGRIVAGFVFLLALFGGLALYSLLVQNNLARQIELITMERGEWLDRANALRNRVQDANRAVIQHANSRSVDNRQGLVEDYQQASEAVEQTYGELSADLAEYPALV
ncbi:MAG: hypothetical protein ACX931_07615 [Saccharospirillum sp.]